MGQAWPFHKTPRVGYGFFGLGMTGPEFDTKRADLKSSADQINESVFNCKVPNDLAKEWGWFYARWRDYYANESTNFNPAASTLLDWEVKMGVWQKRLADVGCKETGPVLPSSKDEQKANEPSMIPWWAPLVLGGVIVTVFAFTPIGAAIGAAMGAAVHKLSGKSIG